MLSETHSQTVVHYRRNWTEQVWVKKAVLCFLMLFFNSLHSVWFLVIYPYIWFSLSFSFIYLSHLVVSLFIFCLSSSFFLCPPSPASSALDFLPTNLRPLALPWHSDCFVFLFFFIFHFHKLLSNIIKAFCHPHHYMYHLYLFFPSLNKAIILEFLMLSALAQRKAQGFLLCPVSGEHCNRWCVIFGFSV